MHGGGGCVCVGARGVFLSRMLLEGVARIAIFSRCDRTTLASFATRVVPSVLYV